MEGRWDGDYKDGIAPQAWTGSLPIMERYLSSGGVPVKYGQCWVFSALVVTGKPKILIIISLYKNNLNSSICINN